MVSGPPSKDFRKYISLPTAITIEQGIEQGVEIVEWISDMRAAVDNFPKQIGTHRPPKRRCGKSLLADRQGFADSRREQTVAPAIQQRGPAGRLF
jgi:hypothetical protein